MNKKTVLIIVIFIVLFLVILKVLYKNNESEFDIKVDNIVIENSNSLSKDYVKNGDTINIIVYLNKKVDNNIKVMINDEIINYTVLEDNVIKIIKNIVTEDKLDFRMYYSNREISRYNMPRVDNEIPKCTLSQEGDYLRILGSDNIGVRDYAISKDANYLFSDTTTIKYDSVGLYHGYIRDYAGNIGTCSIDIQKQEVNINPSNITIVGDSRMVGLCQNNWYKSEGGTCIAKISMGYKWLNETAVNEVNKLPFDNRKYIVSNLGVNDLYNVNNYISKYQNLAVNDWKDSTIFLVSVNPTTDKESYLNSKIDEFNANVYAAFLGYNNVAYCDTNSYLKQNGFQSFDGMHYKENTSKVIYSQIKKCIYDYFNK